MKIDAHLGEDHDGVGEFVSKEPGLECSGFAVDHILVHANTARHSIHLTKISLASLHKQHTVTFNKKARAKIKFSGI